MIPKRSLMPLAETSLPCFLLFYLVISEISHKWNHSVYGLLCLAFFPRVSGCWYSLMLMRTSQLCPFYDRVVISSTDRPQLLILSQTDGH